MDVDSVMSAQTRSNSALKDNNRVPSSNADEDLRQAEYQEIRRLKDKLRKQRNIINSLKKSNFGLEEKIARCVEEDVNPKEVLSKQKEKEDPPSVSRVTSIEPDASRSKHLGKKLHEWLRAYFRKWKGHKFNGSPPMIEPWKIFWSFVSSFIGILMIGLMNTFVWAPIQE
jgi:hypothetical protein